MSRDLTCNETISALDDSDNLTSVKRLRELGPAYAGQIELIGNNRAGPAITTINHNTTVRDVVSSRIRNNKIKNNLHHHVTVNANDLTGPPSFIHTFINNASDHRMPTRVEAHTVIGNHQSKYLHNSSTLSVNSFLAKSNVVNSVIGQQQRSTIPPIGIASANLPAGFGATYYSSGKPSAAAAIQSTSQAQTMIYSNTSVFQTTNNSSAVGMIPVQLVQQHQKPQQLRSTPSQIYAAAAAASQDFSVGSVVKAAANISSSAAKAARSSSPYTAVALSARNATEDCAASGESPARTTPVPGSTTPTNSQQPSNNSHSSPRPSILRGSGAVRRLVDRDAASRPESASGFSGAETEEVLTSISNNNNNNSNAQLSRHPSANNLTGLQQQAAAGSSSGEDSNPTPFPSLGCRRLEDSPRKRPRKQQFDNSQQDKLMMKIRSDQSASLHSTIESIVRQQTTATPDINPTTLSSVLQPSTLKLATQLNKVSGKAATSKVARSRGRPRSTAPIRDAPSPFPPSLPPSQQTNFATSNGISASTSSIASAIQAAPPVPSFKVELDSMLEDEADLGAVKKRKYRKRKPPELDPDTGEPVKKPRKKGSGRKKKELCVDQLSATPANLVSATPSTSTNNNSSSSTLVNYASVVDVRGFSGGAPDGKKSPAPPTSAEEQFVINALRNFKSNKQMGRAAAATTINCDSHIDLNDLKMEPSPSLDSVASSTDSFFGADLPSKNDRRGSFSTRFKRKLSTKELIKPTSSSSTVPLMLDLKQFGGLRSILRRCDRRKHVDTLEDSYEELSTFLKSSKAKTSVDLNTFGDASGRRRRRSSPASTRDWGARRDISCQVFDSYDEFKASCNSLRLLPLACSYFNDSQRLLRDLRVNLHGYSVYRAMKHHLETLGTTPATSSSTALAQDQLTSFSDLLGSNAFESTAADGAAQTRQCIFKNLIDAFNSCGTTRDSDEDQLLLSLDIASTLDNLLEDVDRLPDGLSSHSGARSIGLALPNELKLILPEPDKAHLNSFASVSCDSFAEKLVQRLPECYRSIVQGHAKPSTKRWRSRRRKKNSFLEDHGMESEDGCDTSKGGLDSLVSKLHHLHSQLTKRCDSVQKMALHFLSNLDHINFENAIERCGADNGGNLDAETRSAAEARFLLGVPQHRSSFKTKSNYNPGDSFLFCPTREAVDELFKNHGISVATPEESMEDVEIDCPLAETSAESSKINEFGDKSGEVPKAPSSTSLPSRGKEKSPFFVDDIDGMREDSAYISNLALARLRRRYGAEKFLWESRATSSREEKSKPGPHKQSEPAEEEDDRLRADEEYFEPSLKFRFPVETDTDGQAEFLKNRVRETHELYATVLRLMKSHANLSKQCMDSIASLHSSNSHDPASDELDPNCTKEGADDQQVEDQHLESNLSGNESEGSSESEEEDGTSNKAMALKQQLKAGGQLKLLKSRNSTKDKSGRFTASITGGVGRKRMGTGS